MSTPTSRTVWTGFGDPLDSPSFAYFHVERDPDSGVYPDWEADDSITIRHIPGSDDNDLYDGGSGPEAITLRIWFDSREDYQRFWERKRTTGTLRLIDGFTSIGGTDRHEAGRAYVEHANVFLQRPRKVLHRANGTVACEATFILEVT